MPVKAKAKSNDSVLMLMPDGKKVMVPSKKVKVKQSWGWKIVPVGQKRGK